MNISKVIRSQLESETLNRSLAASVIFIFFSFLHYFSEVYEKKYQFIFFILFVLLIPIANLIRLVPYFVFKKRGLSPFIIKTFEVGAILNGLFWGLVCAAGVSFQSEADANNRLFFILAAIAFGNASAFTLSLLPLTHMLFLAGITMPLAATMIYFYRIGEGVFFLVIPIISMAAALYSFSQGRAYRKRTIEKLTGDMSLIESQKKLLEQQAMTEHSNRLSAIGEVTAGVAHEINNPLAILAGYVDILSMQVGTKNKDIEELFQKVQHSVQRIRKVVKSMSLLSSQSKGEAFVTQSLSKVTSDAIVVFEEKLKQNAIRLETQFLEKNDYVNCDAIQITQILVNLINNAIDAVLKIENKQERWIQLSIKIQGESVVFSCINSGALIPPEVQEKLFTPFFTTKPVNQGTGLGLSISRTIAVRHNGELRLLADSTHTTFELSLPLDKSLKH